MEQTVFTPEAPVEAVVSNTVATLEAAVTDEHQSLAPLVS